MHDERYDKSKIIVGSNPTQESPSILQRIANVLISVGLGILLVQVILISGAFQSGNFIGASVIVLFDNYFFLGFLAVCAVIGGTSGVRFINWIRKEIDLWMPW